MRMWEILESPDVSVRDLYDPDKDKIGDTETRAMLSRIAAAEPSAASRQDQIERMYGNEEHDPVEAAKATKATADAERAQLAVEKSRADIQLAKARTAAIRGF